MTSLTGAELIVQALEDEGIPFAFGIPGGQNLELYDALDQSPRTRAVLVTDEQSASFMADGVSRSSQLLGCVNLVPGAGLTHALSGIAEAYMDGVPLLILACGVRTDIGMTFQLHEVPQLAIAGPVTKGQFQVADVGAIYPDIRQACRLARKPPQGPVIVEIPANLLTSRHHARTAPRPQTTDPIADAMPDKCSAAANMLGELRRPLLYLGNGAAAVPADQLIALAERLQAPVATTIQGKGVFPETHPLSLWCGYGAAAPAFVRSVVRSCEGTLAIGCRFAEVATGSYDVAPPAPLIHVDVDPHVLNKNFAATLAIEAEAAGFVRGLLDRLPERDSDDQLLKEISRGHAEVRDQWTSLKSAQGVSGPRLIEAVEAAFGAGTIYAADSGNGLFLTMECLRLNQPGHFLAPVDFSCMGYALPAAIGAQLANPERPVVAFMGDGAFLMTGMELMTATQLQVPVVLFILRDRKLGLIAEFQEAAFGHRSASDLPDFRLDDLCKGLGAYHCQIASDSELSERMNEVQNAVRTGPIVVEVLLAEGYKTFFAKGVVRTNLGRLSWSERARFVGRAIARRLFSG